MKLHEKAHRRHAPRVQPARDELLDRPARGRRRVGELFGRGGADDDALRARAAQLLQEARDRAEADVRRAVFPGQKFEGTSIEPILVAAARDDWATVDTLAPKAPHAAAQAGKRAGKRGNAERAAIAALRNAPDAAAAWLALATAWCANDEPVLARQGLRLALHFGADRKEALGELHKLEATFTQPDNRHLRALVAEVRSKSNDIP